MSAPLTSAAAKAASEAGQTALSDPSNFVLEEVEPTAQLSTEDAYWRLRGMVPPARVTLVE